MALRLPTLRINRTWMMLIAAIGLALLATMLTVRYLKSREASIAAEVAAKAQVGGPRIAVVVPTRDMPVGTPLLDNVVAAREVAADLLYPDAILVDDFDKYKGQSLIRPVLKGRPLLKADLRPMHGDFAGSLEDGARAMTVDIDELNSVAHMVQPGNRVDLMLAMRRDDGGQTVVPFMERMKVLATGQRVLPEGGDDKNMPGGKKTFAYSTLTLEVTPTQGARLALAKDIGKLRFTLRNEKDEQSVDFSVNAQNILDEISARSRRAKRASADGVVEFIVGGQRSGPTAKTVDVTMPASTATAARTAAQVAALPPGVTGVPPLAPPPKAQAPAQAQAPADAAGLTPEMKAELKAILDQ